MNKARRCMICNSQAVSTTLLNNGDPIHLCSSHISTYAKLFKEKQLFTKHMQAKRLEIEGGDNMIVGS